MSKALNDFALKIIENYKDDFAFNGSNDALLQRKSVSVVVRRFLEESGRSEPFTRYAIIGRSEPFTRYDIIFRIKKNPEKEATIGLDEGSYSLRVACEKLFDHLEKKEEKEKEAEDMKFIKEFEKYLPEERVYFGADF